MTMFSSKTPRDLNHDPHPYVDQWGFDRNDDGDSAGYDFDPRPEFDHTQSNEPNPILVALRRQNHDWSRKYAGVYAFDAANNAAWVRAGMPDDLPGSEWAEFERHADKVITRLANLAQIGA